MRAKTQRRSGYVLLAVIAVSVIVITVLSTYARISLRRALQASDAEHSLQQRWGALTLERAVLSRAPGVFEKRDELADLPVPPPTTIRDAITINGVTYDMLLGDEDAKLNLNVVFHQAGLEAAQRATVDVIGAEFGQAIRLIPSQSAVTAVGNKVPVSEDSGSEDSEEEIVVPAAFRSWGEVFDISQLSQQIGSEVALPSVTTQITCWGSGQLNFRRASDDAIMSVIEGVAGDNVAQKILQRFRANPTAGLSVLLTTEVKNPMHRQQLGRQLSESSANFSLWINASTNSNRSIRQFVVMRRDDEGVTQFEKFTH